MCSLSSFCGLASGPWHSRHSGLGLLTRSRCSLSLPCASWQMAQPCSKAGWCHAASCPARLDRCGSPGKPQPRSAWGSPGAAGVRIVALGAIARRARMLHFRLLDLLGLIGVAGDANLLGVGLRQDDFAVLRRLVADVALLFGKRRMHELAASAWAVPTGADRGRTGNRPFRTAGPGAPSPESRPLTS